MLPNPEIPRRPLPVSIAVASALAASQEDRLAMVMGLKLYQGHSFSRPATNDFIIWQNGTASIRHIPSVGKEHLLLIPSMINRSVILDLLPEQSFARWFAGQGVDVYILDWGDPINDPEQQKLDDILVEKLMPALSFINQKCGNFHALGYCMGGMLLAGAVQMKPPGLDKIIYLASPWDFHVGNRQLQQQVLLGTPSALQMTEHERALPSGWIQTVFAAVNAERNIHKFADFSRMDQDSVQARLFVAVEDWLNDGVDLPAALARTCVIDWYGQNKPAKGEWSVGGQVVNPADTKNPVLIVSSSTDRLVPQESSHALASLIPHACILKSSCGHIGMMTGRRAQDEVWKLIAAWIAA